MRFRLRHPLSIEWHHYEHHWASIWIAVTAIAIGILGIGLQFSGHPYLGFGSYLVALALGFYAALRMSRYNREI